MAETTSVLVMGFEAFGGEELNASWEAIQLLPNVIEGHQVERLRLPVEFGRSGDLACEAVRALSPAAIIAVGEASGRAHLTIERIAVNIMSASIPDNAGIQPKGEPIIPDGPDAYLSTLPIDRCVESCRAAGVPAEPSQTAGLYVCNQVMYRLLHEQAVSHRNVPTGFVHVPNLPEQVLCRPGTPFSPADLSSRGIAAIIAACLC